MNDLNQLEENLIKQELKIKEKMNVIKKKKKMLSAKKRKARTKRLIEKGAVLERLQGSDAENIQPADTEEWLLQTFTGLTFDNIPVELVDSEIMQKNLTELNSQVQDLKHKIIELKYEQEKNMKQIEALESSRNEIKNKFSYFSKIASTLTIDDNSALEVIKQRYEEHKEQNSPNS